MKKLFMLLMFVFPMAMASHHALAQEITITLNPGWNWISYTNAEAMDIVSALGDFVPVDGDRIQSISGNSTYNGGIWRGGFTQFMPGCGYMYYSARTETVEFVFAHASSSVTTAMPTDITVRSAVVGGTVNLPEGSHVFQRGICWGVDPNPDIDGNHTSNGTDVGSFSSTLGDLNHNTTYYVRAYAATVHGLVYGEQMMFTTLEIVVPTVTTIPVYDISPTAAFCGGNVTSEGNGIVTARGVCWSTSDNPTVNDNTAVGANGTGGFYSAIMGLTPGTTYYLRAYATNEVGTGYGEIQPFTTLDTYVSNVGIVAHRGFYQFSDPSGNPVRLPGSAENSRASVKNAINCDFEGVEFDVQITKDNKLIVFHNLNMNGNKIYQTNYATLQTLPEYDLGENQTVPTLAALLWNCRDRLQNQEQRLGYRHTKLFLEVKKHPNMTDPTKINTLVNEIIRYVEQYGVQDDIFFISFNMEICQMLKERMPNAPVAYLSRPTQSSSVGPAYSPQELLDDYDISHIDYEYMLFQNNSTNPYHPEWVEQAHNLSMTVNAWTIDDEPTANEMRTLGVDYITTNRPLNMRAWFATEP